MIIIGYILLLMVIDCYLYLWIVIIGKVWFSDYYGYDYGWLLIVIQAYEWLLTWL